jgi:hypothetical protein
LKDILLKFGSPCVYLLHESARHGLPEKERLPARNDEKADRRRDAQGRARRKEALWKDYQGKKLREQHKDLRT